MCQMCLQGVSARARLGGEGAVSPATYYSGVDDANGVNFATGTGDNNVDGLLIGTRWNSTNLTFAFPTASSYFTTPYEIAPGSFDDGYVASFSAFNASWQAAAREALSMFASVSGLTFTEVSSTTQADVVFAQTSDASISTASGRFPGYSANEGHQWYRTSNYDTNPVQGTYTWHTIIHETGHTMGLAHGHSADSINPAWTGVAMNSNRDGMEFSIMTYREYPGAVIDGYSNETFGYAQTLMMYDIRAIQQLYGANFNTNSGNTTYTWDANTGDMFVNGVQETNPGANRIFLTIWDGNGIDTYDMSNYTTNLVVDLTPGSWSTLSAAQLANLGNNVFARANVFNALLFNEDARSLIENATGGTGNDQLVGNRAVNTLLGNNGQDVLVGAGGNDVLRGGEGNDTLWGDSTTGSTPVSGIGMGSGLHTHANIYDSAAAAFNLTNTFSLAANANIADAATVPHTTMRYSSATAGEQQWYRITLNAGSTITLDIDATTGGLDTYIRLYGSDGTTVLAFNDDNGSDTGSTSTLDSRLTFTVTTTGVFYIFVGSYPGGTTLPANASYDLHVSVAPPSSTALGTDGPAGHDSLYGDAGDDTLNGGVGNDLLVGGLGADVLNGGIGGDTASYLASLAGVTVDLRAGAVGSGGDAQGDTWSSIENVTGSVHNDVIFGSLLANRLVGSNGNDQLIGFGGSDTLEGGNHNDVLNGGLGADILNGGSGIDTASYASSLGAVTVDLRAGATGVGNDAAGDTWISIENVAGSNFGDTIIGNVAVNNLNGRGGADRITGFGGNDVMTGGTGNDIFVIGAGHGNDIITDFDATSGDRIDLSTHSLWTSFASLVTAGAMTQVGANVVINLGFASSVRLNNVNLADINAADFIF